MDFSDIIKITEFNIIGTRRKIRINRLEDGSLMREVSLVRNTIKRIDDQTKSFNFVKVLNFVKVFQYNIFGYSIEKNSI